MKHQESKIQQSCVSWFRHRYPQLSTMLFAVPNGAARPSPVTGAILKAEGVTRGVADLLLLVPSNECHGMCIEMKSGIGRQTPQQKQWQHDVECQGYRYVICRSVGDFVSEIENYFTPSGS